MPQNRREVGKETNGRTLLPLDGGKALRSRHRVVPLRGMDGRCRHLWFRKYRIGLVFIGWNVGTYRRMTEQGVPASPRKAGRWFRMERTRLARHLESCCEKGRRRNSSVCLSLLCE